jgi:hypothetical protein
LGKAQAARASSLKLGQNTARLFDESPQLRDGRWLSIPVRCVADAEDVEKLLQVKVRPVSDRTESDLVHGSL